MGLRAAAGLVAAAVILGGAVGEGLAGETHQLPVSVGQLGRAVDDSASVLACFQGVQDDLFVDPQGQITPASVVAASRRLSGCPVAAAVSAAHDVSVPPAPPVELGAWGTIRRDVVSAQQDMARGSLDMVSTRRAMVRDLAGHRYGTEVVLAYRAAYADYAAASDLEGDATARLARMGVRVPVVEALGAGTTNGSER